MFKYALGISAITSLLLLSSNLSAQGLFPEEIKIWTHVYIPGDTSNEFIQDHPSGETVVSDPLGIACYSTDGRGPTDDKNASSRIHALVTLKLISEAPWVEVKEKDLRIGETKEYGCATTEINCEGTADFEDDDIEVSRDGNLLRVHFDLASGNPCSFFATQFGAIDVDYQIEVDLLKREYKYSGEIADFPNYEAYLQYDEQDPVRLFSYEVASDSSPTSLLGDADKAIEGEGQID